MEEGRRRGDTCPEGAKRIRTVVPRLVMALRVMVLLLLRWWRAIERAVAVLLRGWGRAIEGGAAGRVVQRLVVVIRVRCLQLIQMLGLWVVRVLDLGISVTAPTLMRFRGAQQTETEEARVWAL